MLFFIILGKNIKKMLSKKKKYYLLLFHLPIVELILPNDHIM